MIDYVGLVHGAIPEGRTVAILDEVKADIPDGTRFDFIIDGARPVYHTTKASFPDNSGRTVIIFAPPTQDVIPDNCMVVLVK